MLFVVGGSDDQAIYGWRGANVQNILTFEDRYEDVKSSLVVNFRSTKAIVKQQIVCSKNNSVYIAKRDTVITRMVIFKFLVEFYGSDQRGEAGNGNSRIKSLIGTTYIE